MSPQAADPSQPTLTATNGTNKITFADGRVLTLNVTATDGTWSFNGSRLAFVDSVGQRILAAVLADLTTRGVTRVVVGTGNSGVGQLAFYQKAGFRLWKIERDFFGPERGYPDGLEENGIPLRDMVWMDQTL
jgi:hypothetical protein